MRHGPYFHNFCNCPEFSCSLVFLNCLPSTPCSRCGFCLYSLCTSSLLYSVPWAIALESRCASSMHLLQSSTFWRVKSGSSNSLSRIRGLYQPSTTWSRISFRPSSSRKHNAWRVPVKLWRIVPGGGGGGTSVMEGDRDVPLDRVWFCRSSILAQGIKSA